MKWFKLHSEFCHDPKLATFTKPERYDLVHLFCLASESAERGAVALDQEDLAAVLSLSFEEYQAFESKLERKGIVRREGSYLSFPNWEKRQYDKPSDTPERVSERVKRHRNAHCNATVTRCNALDTDTEYRVQSTEHLAVNDDKARTVEVGKTLGHAPAARGTPTSSEKSASDEFLAAVWQAYPLKVAKPEGLTAIRKALVRVRAGKDAPADHEQWPPPDPERFLLERTRMFARCRARDDPKFTPHPATWFNAARYSDDPSTWGGKEYANGTQNGQPTQPQRYSNRQDRDRDNLARSLEYQRQLEAIANGTAAGTAGGSAGADATGTPTGGGTDGAGRSPDARESLPLLSEPAAARR